MQIDFYRGYALCVRMNAADAKSIEVYRGWDTGRSRLLHKAISLDEAMRWCDESEKHAEARIKEAQHCGSYERSDKKRWIGTTGNSPARTA